MGTDYNKSAGLTAGLPSVDTPTTESNLGVGVAVAAPAVAARVSVIVFDASAASALAQALNAVASGGGGGGGGSSAASTQVAAALFSFLSSSNSTVFSGATQVQFTYAPPQPPSPPPSPWPPGFGQQLPSAQGVGGANLAAIAVGASAGGGVMVLVVAGIAVLVLRRHIARMARASGSLVAPLKEGGGDASDYKDGRAAANGNGRAAVNLGKGGGGGGGRHPPSSTGAVSSSGDGGGGGGASGATGGSDGADAWSAEDLIRIRQQRGSVGSASTAALALGSGSGAGSSVATGTADSGGAKPLSLDRLFRARPVVPEGVAGGDRPGTLAPLNPAAEPQGLMFPQGALPTLVASPALSPACFVVILSSSVRTSCIR